MQADFICRSFNNKRFSNLGEFGGFIRSTRKINVYKVILKHNLTNPSTEHANEFWFYH